MRILHNPRSQFLSLFIYFIFHLFLTGCAPGFEVLSITHPPKNSDNPTDSPTDNPIDNITLSWIPPTSRVNQSPLSSSEIGGYIIYWGTKSGVYTDHLDIGNTTSHTFKRSDFASDVIYVVLTTYDNSEFRRESSYSNEIVVKVKYVVPERSCHLIPEPLCHFNSFQNLEVSQ